MATWKITREKPVMNDDGNRKYEKRKDGRNEPVSDWLPFSIFVGTFDAVNKHIETLQAQGGSFGATMTHGDPESAKP